MRWCEQTEKLLRQTLWKRSTKITRTQIKCRARTMWDSGPHGLISRQILHRPYFFSPSRRCRIAHCQLPPQGCTPIEIPCSALEQNAYHGIHICNKMLDVFREIQCWTCSCSTVSSRTNNMLHYNTASYKRDKYEKKKRTSDDCKILSKQTKKAFVYTFATSGQPTHQDKNHNIKHNKVTRPNANADNASVRTNTSFCCGALKLNCVNARPEQNQYNRATDQRTIVATSRRRHLIISRFI